MQTQVRLLEGNWDAGFALHKHSLSSTYLGDNEAGRPQFETIRSEPGEALYRLKYQGDWAQVSLLAQEVATTLVPLFAKIGFIVPMPPSKQRARQPVTEIARALGKLAGIPVFENLLVKSPQADAAAQLKDLTGKDAKLAALVGRFTINDEITNEGIWNVLLLDDLFDTGASMESACAALRTYRKIRHVFVAALTWK
jgi:predicted amidophosphoribosyltransferase